MRDACCVFGDNAPTQVRALYRRTFLTCLRGNVEERGNRTIRVDDFQRTGLDTHCAPVTSDKCLDAYRQNFDFAGRAMARDSENYLLRR